MLKRLLYIGLVALGSVALLASWAAGGQSQNDRAMSAGKTAPAVESPAVYRDARYEPSNRRDPFLNPLLFKKKEDVDEEVQRGNPPPGIAGMKINDVELLGFSLSPEGKIAVFRGTDKRVYFLHEGDRMFDGFVKVINLDSVQLIRETKMRSGKVLTQDVTKRLRT
jgi:hypothetical protein